MTFPKKIRNNLVYIIASVILYSFITYWFILAKRSRSSYNILKALRRDRPGSSQEETAHHQDGTSESKPVNTYNDWKEMLQCQAYRQGRLHKQCDALGLTRNLTLMSEAELQEMHRFMVDEHHQLILKSIPKSGCSSWKKIVMENHPDYEKHKDIWEHDWTLLRRRMGFTTLDRLRKDEIVYRLLNYYTVLTVRHPLTRLESFFKNKAVDETILVNKTAAEKEQFYENEIGKRFQEFLDWMMTQPVMSLNQHFAPYTAKLARNCVVPYRFISKTETAEPEMQYVIEHYLSKKGNPMKANTSQNFTSPIAPRRDGGTLLPVFSKLADPIKTISEIEKVIGDDMKIFGYGYKIENNLVIATCESYHEFGYCC